MGYTQLTRFVARGLWVTRFVARSLWVLLAMLTLSENS